VINRDSRYAECEVLGDGSLGLRLAPSASPNPNVQLHVVVTGDRLDVLAHHYCGDAALWWLIADGNGITFPFELQINSVLNIPAHAM